MHYSNSLESLYEVYFHVHKFLHFYWLNKKKKCYLVYILLTTCSKFIFFSFYPSAVALLDLNDAVKLMGKSLNFLHFAFIYHDILNVSLFSFWKIFPQLFPAVCFAISLFNNIICLTT